MINRKKFSVIAVDYEFHVPREGMKKGIESLANQTFKDFELIICHDGPKEVPYEEEIDFKELGLSPIIINTPQHMGNWGHSSRDMAMRQARGEFFIHFNIDNIFYPEAFEKINDSLERTNLDVAIFTIIHHKEGGRVFSGLPPAMAYIDCMQLVAHRDIWQKINYWYDLSYASDGFIYPHIASEYPYVHIIECLGENF